MISKEFIVIPFWVENVLNRNKMDLIDVLNYSKLKSIFSINDISQLLSLQKLEESKTIKELNGHWCLFSSWRRSAQESQMVELDSVVDHLSCSKDLQRDLSERLSMSFLPLNYNEGDPKYRIVDFNRDVTAIVLNPGFLDFERDFENYFIIISDLLKSLYVYNSVTEVSDSSFFNTYVQLIEQRLKSKI